MKYRPGVRKRLPLLVLLAAPAVACLAAFVAPAPPNFGIMLAAVIVGEVKHHRANLTAARSLVDE